MKNITSKNNSIETRIGRLDFNNGFPKKDTSTNLRNNLKFQRAMELYIWALPIVSFEIWKNGHFDTLKTDDLELVGYETFKEKLNILTPNATTPYLLGFFDLSKTGPITVTVPAGKCMGGGLDLWQRPLVAMGLAGIDKGEGGVYIIAGPDQEVEESSNVQICRSRTSIIFLGFRSLERKPLKTFAESILLQTYESYKNGQKAGVTKYSNASKSWDPFQPRGYRYWEVLNEIIHREPNEDKDALAYANLKFLNIGEAEHLELSEEDQRILAEASLVGEATVRELDYSGNIEARRFSGSLWENALNFSALTQMDDGYLEMDERATWFYEAVTAADTMNPKKAGEGSTYLTARKDNNEEWLNGSNVYRLRIPKDVPAGRFWSITAYDNDTRTFIDNKWEKADVSSVNPLLEKEEDGSVYVYFSPTKPETVSEHNWIPTLDDSGWFCYFRLYQPLEAFFKHEWSLPNIEKL